MRADMCPAPPPRTRCGPDPNPPGCANWHNRTLFRGDNLAFLRAMNSGSVDLIATDPPFNKGRSFRATRHRVTAGARFRDRWSWGRDVRPEWMEQLSCGDPRLVATIVSARATHSPGMGAYLCFMAVRLLEMHRVLRSTGSIYLHCDPTASHYLKAVLDAVFGSRQFRNEIIWVYGLGGSARHCFSQKHDCLLFYTKSARYTFHKPRTPATSRRMKGELKGMTDIWADIPSLNNQAKERTGYPAQKPLALYRRIICASSNPGDMVLDPFCGCATTPIAAEQLQRQWVGIDSCEQAHEMMLHRLAKEGLAPSSGPPATPGTATVDCTATLPTRTDHGREAAA